MSDPQRSHGLQPTQAPSSMWFSRQEYWSGVPLPSPRIHRRTVQNCTKLHDTDNHDGVITHLEPDILECEVKWALESITMNKASGGDGIPVELFQILKDDAVKVLHSICQQIWKTQQWPQDWKRSLFTFMHWRRKWQPTPVFLPGESQGRESLVGCRLWGCTELDKTEAT